VIYGDWIGRWGAASPDKEAVFDTVSGQRWTYAQLSADVNRLANYLRTELGIVKGDRVACLSANRPEYIILFFALSRLGAILVPLNLRLAVDEFIYFFEDSAPKALFFDAGHQETIARLGDKITLPPAGCFDDDDSLGPALARLWPELDATPPPPVDIRPEDPQLFIYTSGTTGLPKGVIQTHGMLTWNSLNTIVGWDMSSTDKTILHPAMFYTAGWNVFTLPVFLARGTNILMERFEADLVLELIQREKVTMFFGVPTMYQMMSERPGFAQTDLSSIRFMVSGGAPLPRQVIDLYQDEKGIRLWEGYGLTEVGPNDFMANGPPGTIGQAMPFMDVELVDDEGRPVPPGTDGEIVLAGPNLAAGYWNKPQATAESFQDGKFFTGDLGRMDDEGHFAIVGRKKDMFISGGINVYPAEIERVIETHRAVAGAAVIGVSDPKWGEVGKAVVQLKPGATLSLDELTTFLSDKLGKYKLPKYMTTIETLPRTPASEKIQKFLLKQSHGQPDND
jgi:fatty-acyl-CoA synthase